MENLGLLEGNGRSGYPGCWRRLRFSITSLPQSSPSVPATVTQLQKMKSGSGRMKNLPLKENIRPEGI